MPSTETPPPPPPGVASPLWRQILGKLAGPGVSQAAIVAEATRIAEDVTAQQDAQLSLPPGGATPTDSATLSSNIGSDLAEVTLDKTTFSQTGTRQAANYAYRRFGGDRPLANAAISSAMAEVARDRRMGLKSHNPNSALDTKIKEVSADVESLKNSSLEFRQAVEIGDTRRVGEMIFERRHRHGNHFHGPDDARDQFTKDSVKAGQSAGVSLALDNAARPHRSFALHQKTLHSDPPALSPRRANLDEIPAAAQKQEAAVVSRPARTMMGLAAGG